jgi:CRP-like cAMP-binding protein
VVGEMSLLTGEPRMATLTVAESSEVLTFDREAFVALLGLKDAVPERLADLAAERMAQNRAAAVPTIIDAGRFVPRPSRSKLNWRQRARTTLRTMTRSCVSDLTK